LIQSSSLLAAIPHGLVRVAAPAPGAAGSFALPGAAAAAEIPAAGRQILAVAGKALPEQELDTVEGEEAPDGADIAFAWFALPVAPQPVPAVPLAMAPRPVADGAVVAKEGAALPTPSLPIAGDGSGTAAEPEISAAAPFEPQPEVAEQPAPIALRVAAPPAPAETPAMVPVPTAPLFAAGPATSPETRRTLVQDLLPVGSPTAFADIARPHAIAAAVDVQQGALDMRRQEWMGQMVEHIEALRDAAPARETRLSLAPEALGKVDVSIRQDGDRIHVHFATETQAARQLIADAQPRLAELAEARGLKLGQTDVDSGAGQGSRERQPDLPPQSFAPHAPEAPDAAPATTDDRIA
jgi:flagellar hook-length control protein FliK